MKNFLTIIAVAMGIALGMHFGSSVNAQTTGVPWQFGVSGTHTSCTIVTGATQFCAAGDGLWQSLNGGPFTLVGASPLTGVTSFNGRTGAVVSIIGDYSYSQLSSQPTSLSCPVFNLSTSGSTSGTSGSAAGTCSFK